jgi:hypothetical protein
MSQVLAIRRFSAFKLLALALPLLASAPLHAQTAATAAVPALAKFNGADTAWMLISTVLVLLMTIPGIMLFYSGMMRAKNALSIVAQFQRQNWKSHPSTGDKYNPDFAAIAQAYGIPGVTIQTREEMPQKLRVALNRHGPVVIHCHVDPEEELLHMLLGGHTLDDMSYETTF